MGPKDGSAVPKPGPPRPQQQWFQERRSDYAWEQDGLDHIRRLMPRAEPYRGWATFSFTAASGRINECDLLIAVPGGLYLVELKAHPGRVVNNGETWSFYSEGSRRGRTLRNPLHLNDLKSKELKSQLKWAASSLRITDRLPRVEPAVFLSASGLVSELDDVQRSGVYGRDEDCTGLPWIWRDLLARPPQRESQRVTPDFSRRVLPQLLKKIGIRVSTAHLRFGDDWMLTDEPLDAGPTWEDRLAERKGIVHEEGRVRIYLTEQQATEDRRRSVERAARREYQVLQGITHRGIAQAVEIREHQGGPAILFRHRASDLRLDSYLALHGERLAPEVRLDLLRQLGEAVRYAHSRSLYHRALAASSAYVSAKEDGSSPVLRIIDWQSAARDFDTTGMSSIGKTSLGGEHVPDAASIYLAPETDTPYVDPIDLDVFGLGALSYLIITGQPPASSRSGLIDRLSADGGLHPYAVADSVSNELDGLIFDATAADIGLRLPSAEAFLARLALIEQESPAPESVTPTVDPMTAAPGQLIDRGWMVQRVLGTGATARALLIESVSEDDDEPRAQRVLKIAIDEEKAERLRAEAKALELVGGGVVVQLLDGPRQLGGRTVLDLEYAGEESLGATLRAEGRLSYHDLERFGADLFIALDQLAGKGIRHRDVKPDNFGILKRADRSRQLKLFDFSLHGVSERDVRAGTRGYLDPFLGSARRPAFDDHAERYAAAVTLHEMASTTQPVWGDGITDPRTTEDETPAVAADLFEPALRDGLSEFFLRAFHRDVDRRFDTLRQMEMAWRSVFTNADAASPATTPATVGVSTETVEETRAAHAEAAELNTPLEAAGLSPRAVSVAQGFGATTVSELLDVPLYQIAKARGAGAVIRKELNRRHKQWTAALRRPENSSPDQEGPAAPALTEFAGTTSGALTVDDLALLLAPRGGRKGSAKADVLRLTLGLPDETGVPEPWQTQSEIAKRLGITQAAVSHHQRLATKAWAVDDRLIDVRNELVEIVGSAGRVMTVHELAAALRAGHGAADDTRERTMARAHAVVRAAVEAEIWAGLHPADELDGGPRLAVLRRGSHVYVALESLVGTDDPSAPELADFAVALGRRADELIQQDPLPGRGVVLRELRAVPAPEGLSPLADTRLVELASVASERAEVSPRLELYPRDLDLTKALRISQAGAGVRRTSGVTVEELLAKVRARFPDLDLGERLTHVRIEEALQEAKVPLKFDTATKRFYPPELEYSRLGSSTATSLSAHGTLAGGGTDPEALIASKLSASAKRGGFLALTVRGRHLPGTAEAMSAAYPVRSVDLNREFLTEFRALVIERGQTWDKVLAVDARFGETKQISPGLASYVRTAWQRVEHRLLELAAVDEVLFLNDAGLLARYFDDGGRELLTKLQNAARRPNDVPRGLWLLCPGESAVDTPQLDGRTVEVLGESERVTLTGPYLASLRDEPGMSG